MTKTLFQRGGLALLLASMLLTGCDPKKTEDASQHPTNYDPGKRAEAGPPVAGSGNYKIITNGISPFWDSLGKGLDVAKADLKVQGSWTGPSPADHNTQVNLLKEAVASKVDGIAVSPIEAEALTRTIDDTIAGGVPVITFDSDAPKSKRLAYIGTNNYEAGKMAGEETLKLFPNGGKFVAFVGNMGAQNARDRYQGFVDATKGKIEFLQTPFEDNKNPGAAKNNVSDAITKYGDKINGFLGLYSYNGPAIVNAVKAQPGMRQKVKIVCFDGEPATLKNLAEGNVDVTIVQKPYEFGRLSMLLLNAYKETKDITKALDKIKPELDKINAKVKGNIVDTGVTIVTPANSAAFLKDLKDKGLEST